MLERLAGTPSSSESEAEADEEAEPEERKRTSAKASFVAKIFSPVMGYGACYELQHFVYDLWLASSLGGARNASNTTLRGALAGRVFSPMYWQTQHAALVDCVRQIGLPHLFITIAPLELLRLITPGFKTSSRSCFGQGRGCRPRRPSIWRTC